MSAAESGDPTTDLLSQPPGDATVLRMMLGSRLRQLREAAKVTPEQAGYEIRASRSKISRMENGRVSFKGRDIIDLLNLYGVTDDEVRQATLELARRANVPGWWAKYGDILPDWFELYLGLESSAAVIRTFELQFIPGLLQTEDYARAVTALGHRSAPADEINRRVALRMRRQHVLSRPEPAKFWAVMDEAALHRPVGGRDVMRAQLRHLAQATAAQHVTVQVVPFRSGGHAAAGGSFSILRFDQPDLPDVVYIEQLTSALYLENRQDVDHYQEVMNQLSTDALTPAETADFIEAIIADT
ncbi:MAG TPA: helix-turn-helix transcriptional regulator [Streptosporangiaceae bacterium]|jgi:transcriptional regulator with XRE-family HTH domain